MAVQRTVAILVLYLTGSVFANYPTNTIYAKQDLVTRKMLKDSGKKFVMVLDVDFTILVRFKPHVDSKTGKIVCHWPGIALRMDSNGVILECGIMRPGFEQFIMKVKKVFFLIIYTANDLENAKVIVRTLESMYPGTHFEVRALLHMHYYPELKRGEKLVREGGKDLLNIIKWDLIPLTVILEDDPTWYFRLLKNPNQFLCIIQVPALMLEWSEKDNKWEVFYDDTTLEDIGVLLAPVGTPDLEGNEQTLRQILNTERNKQKRTNTNEPWIRSMCLSHKTVITQPELSLER